MENFTTQGVQNCPVVKFDQFSCKFTKNIKRWYFLIKFNKNILGTWYNNPQQTVLAYLFSIKSELQFKFTVHTAAENSATNLVHF